MKPHLLTAAIFALAAQAGANPWPNGFPTAPPPGQGGMHGHHGLGRGGILIIEQPPVIVEREVVREVPVAAPAPPAPRLHRRRASPMCWGGRTPRCRSPCMKLVERGAAYFQCSGKWYRSMGADGPYRAVARP